MNWYLQSGNKSDVVTSTKIKFNRNIIGYPFDLKNKEQIEKMQKKIKESIYQIGYNLKYIMLKDIDEISLQSLVEKNIITKEYAKNKNGLNSILINDEENICIMLNGEDHLEIQIFSSGLDIKNTLNYGIEIDNKIDEILGYAKSKKYGYLTTYPNNCGTGLKITVKLELPALLETKNMRTIVEALSNFELNIKEVENEKNTFEISNIKTLGIKEEEIAQEIKIITEKIVEKERKLRKIIANQGIELEDKIYRSYGILQNCRKLSLDEAKKYLSIIKLGKDIGILQELTDTKIKKMIINSNPATLEKYLGNKYDKIDLDIKRAETLKQIMMEK